MLSSPESLEDTTNHCVPIIDHFRNDAEPGFTYLVMPLLRDFDDPEFYSISEMLDFVGQTLQVNLHIHSIDAIPDDAKYRL